MLTLVASADAGSQRLAVGRPGHVARGPFPARTHRLAGLSGVDDHQFAVPVVALHHGGQLCRVGRPVEADQEALDFLVGRKRASRRAIDQIKDLQPVQQKGDLTSVGRPARSGAGRQVLLAAAVGVLDIDTVFVGPLGDGGKGELFVIGRPIRGRPRPKIAQTRAVDADDEATARLPLGIACSEDQSLAIVRPARRSHRRVTFDVYDVTHVRTVATHHKQRVRPRGIDVIGSRQSASQADGQSQASHTAKRTEFPTVSVGGAMGS